MTLQKKIQGVRPFSGFISFFKSLSFFSYYPLPHPSLMCTSVWNESEKICNFFVKRLICVLHFEGESGNFFHQKLHVCISWIFFFEMYLYVMYFICVCVCVSCILFVFVYCNCNCWTIKNIKIKTDGNF